MPNFWSRTELWTDCTAVFLSPLTSITTFYVLFIYNEFLRRLFCLVNPLTPSRNFIHLLLQQSFYLCGSRMILRIHSNNPCCFLSLSGCPYSKHKTSYYNLKITNVFRLVPFVFNAENKNKLS